MHNALPTRAVMRPDVSARLAKTVSRELRHIDATGSHAKAPSAARSDSSARAVTKHATKSFAVERASRHGQNQVHETQNLVLRPPSAMRGRVLVRALWQISDMPARAAPRLTR